MNELLVTILSLSFSGGIIAILLLLLKPLYKNFLSSSWQYYIWILVFLRMLLPFTPETSLIGILLNQSPDMVIADDTFGNSEKNYQAVIMMSDAALENQPAADNYITDSTTSSFITTVFSIIKSYMWLSIPFITIILCIRKMISYFKYKKIIKADLRILNDEDILSIYTEAKKTLNIKRIIPVYTSASISTPMLAGVFKPVIVLPEIHFTNDNYRMIFCHELIHYKRKDILYKWFVELMVCLHWFNPVVYFARKEILKSCELSCDKAVLTSLRVDEKYIYGEALIALLCYHGKELRHTASVGMSEDGRNIKERLKSIKVHSQSTLAIRLLSFLLTLIMATGAFYLGAYAIPEFPAITDIFTINNVTDDDISDTPDIVDDDISGTPDIIGDDISSTHDFVDDDISSTHDFVDDDISSTPDAASDNGTFTNTDINQVFQNPARFLSISLDGKTYVMGISNTYNIPISYSSNFEEPFEHMLYADKFHFLFHDVNDFVPYNYIIRLHETEKDNYGQIKDSLIIIQGQTDSYKAFLDVATINIKGSEQILRSFTCFDTWAAYLNEKMEDKGAFAIFYIEDVEYIEKYVEQYKNNIGDH